MKGSTRANWQDNKGETNYLILPNKYIARFSFLFFFCSYIQRPQNVVILVLYIDNYSTWCLFLFLFLSKFLFFISISCALFLSDATTNNCTVRECLSYMHTHVNYITTTITIKDCDWLRRPVYGSRFVVGFNHCNIYTTLGALYVAEINRVNIPASGLLRALFCCLC
jgi:hypothetical protein